VRTGLTPRELQIFRLFAQGRTITSVASELGIAPYTVRNHRKHAFEFYDVDSVMGVFAALGWLYVPEHRRKSVAA